MTEAAHRSPRAERARDWFWTTFGIAALLNLCVEVFGMSYLEHGWFLAPRIALSIVWAIAAAVWAWESYRHRRGGVHVHYVGSVGSVPTNLDDLATDGEDATCHVCAMQADVVVQVLDEESAIGSAIFLCDKDASLVSLGDVETISERLALNHEETTSETTGTALLMVHGTGRSLRLRRWQRREECL